MIEVLDRENKPTEKPVSVADIIVDVAEWAFKWACIGALIHLGWRVTG